MARVHSVYRDERACWIQLFKDGDESASVLVRCSLSRDAPTHQRRAGRLGAQATPFPLVLNVMSAA